MVKTVKLTALIEANENVAFDEASINQSLGQLGLIKSFEISLDSEDDKSTQAKVDSTTSQSSSEIVNFIRESNKIYFGTLNIEQRKTLGITVLHAANHEKIMNDETFKSKFISMGSKKFYLDESYITNLLSGTDGDKLFDELKSKFLEGDLTQMFVYIWEMILSIGEEDDLEIELVESSAERYGFEKPLISETICTYYFIIY